MRTAGIALGVLPLAASGVFSRAGYGPFGYRRCRGLPCVADRCPHNASVLLVAGVGALWRATRAGRGRER